MATAYSTQITEMIAGRMAPGATHRAPLLFTGVSFTKPAAGAGATAADVIRLCRVWSSDIIRKLEFESAAWGANGVAEFGLYQTEENGSAVLDADLFASAVDVSAAIAKTDMLREATTIDALERLKPLWLVLGLTTDPRIWYDLSILVTHPGAAQAAAFNVELTFLSGA